MSEVRWDHGHQMSAIRHGACFYEPTVCWRESCSQPAEGELGLCERHKEELKKENAA